MDTPGVCFFAPGYLLGALQVAMNDLVYVQIVHATGDLFGPRDHPIGGHHVLLVLDQIEQGTVGAELHHDAKAGLLRADLHKPQIAPH